MHLIGLAVLLSSSLAYTQTTDAYEEEDDGPYEEDLFENPFWNDLAAHVQSHVDTEGLLRARRWGNVANGILLGATGPITFIVSAFSLRLANAVLSVYLTAMGASLAALELKISPIAPWIRENLSYLSTSNGHTTLLTVAGGLAWAFGRAGLLPAILTCANALFNAYFSNIVDFVSADDHQASSGRGAASDSSPSFLQDAAAADAEPPASAAHEEPAHVRAELQAQLQAARLRAELQRRAAEAAEAEQPQQAEAEATDGYMGPEDDAPEDNASDAEDAQ